MGSGISSKSVVSKLRKTKEELRLFEYYFNEKSGIAGAARSFVIVFKFFKD